jgi:hypothetical protein
MSLRGTEIEALAIPQQYSALLSHPRREGEETETASACESRNMQQQTSVKQASSKTWKVVLEAASQQPSGPIFILEDAPSEPR